MCGQLSLFMSRVSDKSIMLILFEIKTSLSREAHFALLNLVPLIFKTPKLMSDPSSYTSGTRLFTDGFVGRALCQPRFLPPSFCFRLAPCPSSLFTVEAEELGELGARSRVHLYFDSYLELLLSFLLAVAALVECWLVDGRLSSRLVEGLGC